MSLSPWIVCADAGCALGPDFTLRSMHAVSAQSAREHDSSRLHCHLDCFTAIPMDPFLCTQYAAFEPEAGQWVAPAEMRSATWISGSIPCLWQACGPAVT